MRILILPVLIVFLSACTKEQKEAVVSDQSSIEACKADHFSCAATDLKDPNAAEAYKYGCDQKDYYSCYRLGQYYETLAKDLDEALKFYEIACAGKDPYGCRMGSELRAKLCFIEKKSVYCKDEPSGELRMIAFLADLSPQYQDAFIDHHFAKDFVMETTRNLYAKRRAEKSQALLEALKKAQARGKNTGQDAKSLTDEINFLKSTPASSKN